MLLEGEGQEGGNEWAVRQPGPGLRILLKGFIFCRAGMMLETGTPSYFCGEYEAAWRERGLPGGPSLKVLGLGASSPQGLHLCPLA